MQYIVYADRGTGSRRPKFARLARPGAACPVIMADVNEAMSGVIFQGACPQTNTHGRLGLRACAHNNERARMMSRLINTSLARGRVGGERALPTVRRPSG